MMKWVTVILLLFLVACEKEPHHENTSAPKPMAEEGRWLPVKTSGIVFSTVNVSHEHDGWTVKGRPVVDASGVIQAVGSSEEPVMITIGKASSLGNEELLSFAARLSDHGKRRVFYQRAKGNIDSIDSGFEFTR